MPKGRLSLKIIINGDWSGVIGDKRLIEPMAVE